MAWIMPMTKRAAGVSWLWPISRLCFEHSFSVRACALSRNPVGPACAFEESKSRRKLADRKLVCALQRPRREAQKKTQTTNHDHKKAQTRTKSTSYQSRPQKAQKKNTKTQTTKHDHKKNTNCAHTTNHDHTKKHK